MTRDFVTAARALRREPGFVAIVVLTFALAIAANAAMFGLVNRLMLSPPPGIANADRVARVRLWLNEEGGESFPMSTTSYPVFQALRASSGAFSGVAATRPDTMLVGRSPDVTRVAGLGATGDYFTTLGATPALGRFFGASDDVPPAGNPVVVLGDAYWRRAYGGDRSVLGQQIVIGEQPFTIIGVARAGFNGEQLAAVDLFLPLSAMMRGSGSGWTTNHGMKIVSLVVRLRDGVSLAAARTIATASIRGESSADRATLSVDFDPVVPGSSSRQSAQSRIALWLAAVSLIVLLIATANVGTLLSLRAARRRREIAVRVAIGAGRGHLARQLVSESVLLASGGAAAGILLSHWFSGIIRSTLLPNLAPTTEFIDARVLAVSIVAAGVGRGSRRARANRAGRRRRQPGVGTADGWRRRVGADAVPERARDHPGRALHAARRRRGALRAKPRAHPIAGPRLLGRAPALCDARLPRIRRRFRSATRRTWPQSTACARSPA